jgi:hypothetical protein
VVAPVTPPSSPRFSRSGSEAGAVANTPADAKQRTFGRMMLQMEDEDNSQSPSAGRDNDGSVKSSTTDTISPFRASLSQDSGDGDDGGLRLPQDAAQAVVEQQRRLEEDYLQRHGGVGQKSGTSDAPAGQSDQADPDAEAPPSPPPSPSGSPRSGYSSDASPPNSPSQPGSGRRQPSMALPPGALAAAAGADSSAAFSDSLAVGASLALRLGELISPEDDQLLRKVRQGTSGLLENVRSSKSRHVQYVSTSITPGVHPVPSSHVTLTLPSLYCADAVHPERCGPGAVPRGAAAAADLHGGPAVLLRADPEQPLRLRPAARPRHAQSGAHHPAALPEGRPPDPQERSQAAAAG